MQSKKRFQRSIPQTVQGGFVRAIMCNNLLDCYNKKYGLKKYLSPHSITTMLDYEWPGNIRELRNIMERAVIISNGDEITPDTLHI